jgi:myosin-5
VKTESLVPANPDILDGVDDLMQLSYLNEPSVLYNLQYRYNRDMIYVSVCISIIFGLESANKIPISRNSLIAI